VCCWRVGARSATESFAAAAAVLVTVANDFSELLECSPSLLKLRHDVIPKVEFRQIYAAKAAAAVKSCGSCESCSAFGGSRRLNFMVLSDYKNNIYLG
jgi:hypothetical protein